MPDFRAEVYVTLKRSILDPQGRTVEGTLGRLGHDNVSNVRVGKYIELTLSGERGDVEAQVRELARTVLSNPVMEDVRVVLEAAQSPQQS